MSNQPRLPAPTVRDLGVINWVFCKAASRRLRVQNMHLFATLGQHKRLLKAWLPFGGVLLRGKLPKADTELVILRVAHLRGSEYELQHHRRIARTVGLDDGVQAAVFAGPDADGLTERQRVLLTGADELVHTRTLSDDTWDRLTDHLDRPRLIEFVTLVGQYDALAATLSALRVPLDYPQG